MRRSIKTTLFVIFSLVLLILLSVLMLEKKNDNCTPKIEERTVRGDSMSPFLKDGEIVKVDFNYFKCGNLPKKDEVIIYDFDAQNLNLIKMIKTVPRDKFKVDQKDRTLIVNGKEIQNSEEKIYRFTKQNIKMLSLYEKSFNGIMPDGFYFIFGNKPGGIDSGKFGPIQLEKILGKVIIGDN